MTGKPRLLQYYTEYYAYLSASLEGLPSLSDTEQEEETIHCRELGIYAAVLVHALYLCLEPQ